MSQEFKDVLESPEGARIEQALGILFRQHLGEISAATPLHEALFERIKENIPSTCHPRAVKNFIYFHQPNKHSLVGTLLGQFVSPKLSAVLQKRLARDNDICRISNMHINIKELEDYTLSRIVDTVSWNKSGIDYQIQLARTYINGLEGCAVILTAPRGRFVLTNIESGSELRKIYSYAYKGSDSFTAHYSPVPCYPIGPTGPSTADLDRIASRSGYESHN